MDHCYYAEGHLWKIYSEQHTSWGNAEHFSSEVKNETRMLDIIISSQSY